MITYHINRRNNIAYCIIALIILTAFLPCCKLGIRITAVTVTAYTFIGSCGTKN